MESYYELLEVSNKASPEVIEKAYKVLAKRYHPDLQPHNEKKKAEERMKKINGAYDILINEEKRAAYDQELEEQRLREQRENANSNISNNYTTPDMNRVVNPEEQVARGVDPNLKNNGQRGFTPDDLAEKLREQAERQKQVQRAYNDAYIRYMKDLGYKVRDKKTWKDIFKRAVIIFLFVYILLFVFSILWIIPPAREQMIALYNGNIFIRIIVNIFAEIINVIYSLFGG